MSVQGIQATMINSPKLWFLIFRHIVVAPLVSFMVSFCALVPGIFLIAILGQHFGRALCHIFVGFCGVTWGAICLPSATRQFGAMGLTLLGVIYYSGFIAEWGNSITEEGTIVNLHDRLLMEVAMLAVGGLLAVIVVGVRARMAAAKVTMTSPPILNP